jgi:hypothetical protein
MGLAVPAIRHAAAGPTLRPFPELVTAPAVVTAQRGVEHFRRPQRIVTSRGAAAHAPQLIDHSLYTWSGGRNEVRVWCACGARGVVAE